jgi:hypothetical protein
VSCVVPADNSAMHPLFTAVLNEAAPMVESRGWTWPPQSSLADAERLADVTHRYLQSNGNRRTDRGEDRRPFQNLPPRS